MLHSSSTVVRIRHHSGFAKSAYNFLATQKVSNNALIISPSGNPLFLIQGGHPFFRQKIKTSGLKRFPIFAHLEDDLSKSGNRF